MASDIWLRTILIVRKETHCCHIGYSFRLTARVLLYAPYHRQDSTYHSLCYTSRGALAGTRNSSMGPPHEGMIWRPTAPWANALPLSYIPLPTLNKDNLWATVRWPLWKRVKFYWMVLLTPLAAGAGETMVTGAASTLPGLRVARVVPRTVTRQSTQRPEPALRANWSQETNRER